MTHHQSMSFNFKIPLNFDNVFDILKCNKYKWNQKFLANILSLTCFNFLMDLKCFFFLKKNKLLIFNFLDFNYMPACLFKKWKPQKGMSFL